VCVSSPTFEMLDQVTVLHSIMIKIIKGKGKFTLEQSMDA